MLRRKLDGKRRYFSVQDLYLNPEDVERVRELKNRPGVYEKPRKFTWLEENDIRFLLNVKIGAIEGPIHSSPVPYNHGKLILIADENFLLIIV
jgi:hypothetical protein